MANWGAMRLSRAHLSKRGRERDDEVVELTDRLAPYEGLAWRASEQPSRVEPVRPAPTSMVAGRLPRPRRLDTVPQRVLQVEPQEAAPAPEVGPAEPIGVEPATPDTVPAASLVAEEPGTLDAVLAELVKEEAEALETALIPLVTERAVALGMTASRQPRNEPCACGSGRKHKRCCGQRPEAT